MTQENNTKQSRIKLPLIKVSRNDKEYAVLVNQELCNERVLRGFLRGWLISCSDCEMIKSYVGNIINIWRWTIASEIASAKDKLAPEIENIILRIFEQGWRTFKQGDQILTVIVVPLDFFFKECDCNMIGLYKNGDKRMIYKGEYYSGIDKFKLCGLRDNGMHLSYGQTVETIEEFKDAVFKLNEKMDK